MDYDDLARVARVDKRRRIDFDADIEELFLRGLTAYKIIQALEIPQTHGAISRRLVYTRVDALRKKYRRKGNRKLTIGLKKEV
jgi:hypothetical protein